MHRLSLFLVSASLFAVTTASAATLQPGEKEHRRGAKNPTVIALVYSDFECPFCQRYAQTLDQALKKYPDDLAMVFRHMPLSFHRNARMYAQASECAGEQSEEAFWKFHDHLFTALRSGKRVAKRQLLQIGNRSGVDGTAFKKCLASKRHYANIDAQAAAATDAGIIGTPTTYLLPVGKGTAKVVNGAVSLEMLSTEIDALLASPQR